MPLRGKAIVRIDRGRKLDRVRGLGNVRIDERRPQQQLQRQRHPPPCDTGAPMSKGRHLSPSPLDQRPPYAQDVWQYDRDRRCPLPAWLVSN